ncbi:hypothetical protein GGR54DRAFT_638456 [Hypoxylon sp. NC1633]|nr:hypothetical protein GGR54DRAFT_638456 [Hypoxylon sp. NC1633]
MITVSATTEILASPAVVRSVFLNFPHYKQWCPGVVIEPVDAGKKPSELAQGDRIRINMGGFAFQAPILDNSADCFSWKGSMLWLVSGHHKFYFAPSKENPGSTTFTNTEDYGGFLTIFFSGKGSLEHAEKNYERFNDALKKEVEKHSS